MVFENFMKDTRKALNVSQKELAERLNTTFQNLSSYERHRTTCSFDYGMEILNALGVSVIIENNQIKIIGDVKGMSNEMKNRVYKKEDLDFINFNTRDVYEAYQRKIKSNENLNKEEISKAVNNLRDEGYEVYFSRFFNDRLWDADHYPGGEILISVSKGDREVSIVVSGGVDIDMFLFEEFISDIKKNYPQEGAFIEKVLMYECVNNYKGKDIYRAFKHKLDVKQISPLLNGYENIIKETLESKEYFFELIEEYDPRELTISEMLVIFDCYSINYPYYAYKMPDDETIIEPESFEGHDIWDALAHIECAFGDVYDKLTKEYEEYPDDFRKL